MDLTIQTSSNRKLNLQPGLPAGVKALQVPGSHAWNAQGEHGIIFFEELQTAGFTFRFYFFKLIKRMTLYFRVQKPFVSTRIALQNNWRFSIGQIGEMKLHENQFSLFYANGNGEKLVFEKGKEYRCFDAIFDPAKLAGLLEIFPGLQEFLHHSKNNTSCYLVKRGMWTPPEALDIIKDLPACPFKNTLREYYLEHRLDELLFLLLAIALKEEPETAEEPTPDEITAAKNAESLIRGDIRQHHSIPAIARKVHLNEFRLKHVFKQIFKTGIFEYLFVLRMQEARRLLTNTDKPIKEIASLTGYQRLTSFITAFRKHFGYTPGSVRRGI